MGAARVAGGDSCLALLCLIASVRMHACVSLSHSCTTEAKHGIKGLPTISPAVIIPNAVSVLLFTMSYHGTSACI